MPRQRCCEWPLPSVRSLVRARAAHRQGRMEGAFFMTCNPWSPLGPHKGRAKAAALAGQREPGLGEHFCPAPCGFVLPLCLSHGAGLCRHPPLPTAWGAAGPDAGSPLFLQLPGTEGAVGGHTAGVRRGDAPGTARWGNTAPQLGRGVSAAVGSSCPELPDKREEAAWGSPSSLPVPSRCTGHQKEPREPG